MCSEVDKGAGRGLLGFVSGGVSCKVAGMKMYRLFRRVVGLCLLAAAAAAAAAREAEPLLLGDEDDRLLVLAPHPDDEVLGAGGLIQEAVELGVPVRVCFLTMGDNNELAFMFVRKHPVVMPGAVRRMGETRMREAKEAARRMGLDPERDLVFLGYPDYGTLRIWEDHWRDVTPLRSMLTRATAVPYAEARTPGAAYAGEDVLEDLTEVIREFRPTYVAMPSAADQNVDHRALYLFARVALWDLEAEGNPEPERLAYPVHYPHWPTPRRLHPELEQEPPPFLEGSDEIEWQVHSLAPWQVTNKLEAVKAHRSQCLYSSGYLTSFVRTSEWFGDFGDIVLPGGVGEDRVPDGDTGAWSQDDAFLGELASEDAAWGRIAEQQDEEAAETAAVDCDFLDRRISSDGANLTVVCKFSRPVPAKAATSLRFYGWRQDAPFGQMPKIHVRMAARKVKGVTDLDRKLDPGAVTVPAGLLGDEVGVTVPLELLGNPEKLLVSASVSSGEMPLDWAAWRAVDLGAPGEGKARGARPAAPVAAVPAPAAAAARDVYADAEAARRGGRTADGPRLTPRVSAAASGLGQPKAKAQAAPPAAEAEAPVPAKPQKPQQSKQSRDAAVRRARAAAAAGSADEAVVW